MSSVLVVGVGGASSGPSSLDIPLVVWKPHQETIFIKIGSPVDPSGSHLRPQTQSTCYVYRKQVLGSAISSEWSCCGSLPEVSLSSLESCLLTLAESIYVLRLSGTGSFRIPGLYVHDNVSLGSLV